MEYSTCDAFVVTAKARKLASYFVFKAVQLSFFRRMWYNIKYGLTLHFSFDKVQDVEYFLIPPGFLLFVVVHDLSLIFEC